MTVTTMVRLPDWAGEEIKKIAQHKGLAFATVVRSIVVEHLRNARAGNPAETTASAASNPVKERASHDH